MVIGNPNQMVSQPFHPLTVKHLGWSFTAEAIQTHMDGWVIGVVFLPTFFVLSGRLSLSTQHRLSKALSTICFSSLP